MDPLLLGPDTRASFVRGMWQVWFHPDCLGDGLTREEFGRLANTVYHECRHAEQTYRVARKLAAEGNDDMMIATRISIGRDVAKMACANPLSPKMRKEWKEAGWWQDNMEVIEGTSRADLVNAQKDAAMQEYGKARQMWRAMRKLIEGDPMADAQLKAWYDKELSQDGGEAKMQARYKHITDDYVFKRERAKQTFLQYAKMPVEEDAWSTGALVEAHLGLPPTIAESELENLDDDERSLVPLVLLATSGYSAKEQELFSLLKGLT